MTEQLVFLLQLVISGIAVGGVYSLMALGFVLIFKASAVVNFGPGELVLFGAYVAWATILNMKLPLYVALPLTLAIAILLGLVIERGILRPLIGEPIISVIMRSVCIAAMSRTKSHSYTPPSFMRSSNRSLVSSSRRCSNRAIARGVNHPLTSFR